MGKDAYVLYIPRAALGVVKIAAYVMRVAILCAAKKSDPSSVVYPRAALVLGAWERHRGPRSPLGGFEGADELGVSDCSPCTAGAARPLQL